MAEQLDFGWSKVTDRGLEMDRKPTLEEWHTAWDDVMLNRKKTRWARADLYVIAQETEGLGEDVHQFIEPFDISLGTIQTEASTSRKYWGVQMRKFVTKVSFSHHETVQILEPARRWYWLQRSIDEGLTVKDLRELTAEERQEASGREGVAGAHEKTPLEKLKNGRDVVNAAYAELPAGPWVDLVRSGIEDIDEAIEVLQDNLKAEPVGAAPLQDPLLAEVA